ncbi:hypothetical protein M3Y94_00895300 [Aphelenchoides besseyi]|nr:hypothetical protein M3Y94_00895300 [Aphelenchoides besseyi]
MSTVTATQLFYPVDLLENEWCGAFKTCPEGTQCMRTFDRSEPFSCFLPQFGSTFSFIEEPKVFAPHTNQNPNAPPVWMLAFTSFGFLCLIALIVWGVFYGGRRVIVHWVMPSLCRKNKNQTGNWTENPGYESGEGTSVTSKTTSGMVV